MASYIDTASERLLHAGTIAQQRTTALLDRVVAPQQRDEFARHVSSWANRNPRVALFVALHLLTLGPPIVLFTLFCGATVLTAVSLTLLFVLGTCLALLSAVGIFILAPALIIGSATALSLFVAITLGHLLIQRARGGQVAPSTFTGLKRAIGADKLPPKPAPITTATQPTTITNGPVAPSSIQQPNGAAVGASTRPQPARTPSEQKAREREVLARQALGIPASMPVAVTPDAAVAAAAERQRQANGVDGAGEARAAEPERRMQLEEQIRLGEEIARRAMEGKMGIIV